MPHDGNGTFSYTANTVVPDATAGTTIVSNDFDQFSGEVSTALTLAFMKDGQSTATGAFKMGSQKITGMADGAALTDATSVNQVVDGALTHCATPSAVGTDAYAVSLAVNPVTLVTGAMYSFTPEVANTGACSVDFNSIGAKNIKMADAADPYDGAIQADVPCVVQYDGTSMILINPYFEGSNTTASAAEINVLDGVTGGTVTASKAVVVDASKDIGTFGEVTAATFTGTNVDGILGANTPADATALVLKADTSLELAAGATITEFETTSTGSATKAPTSSALDAKVGVATGIETYREATGQSITRATVNTFTHGLSAKPDIVSVYIKCTGADQQYDVGDELVVSSTTNVINASPSGIAVLQTATTVLVTIGDTATPFSVNDKDDGDQVVLDESKWEMYCNAIYFGATVTAT